PLTSSFYPAGSAHRIAKHLPAAPVPGLPLLHLPPPICMRSPISRSCPALPAPVCAKSQPVAAAGRPYSFAGSRQAHGGFALIIALGCMGFMVLLLLSLNMLSSTELSVGQPPEALARARSNAILGLNVALGELQATLGPDQRISATAGIRSSASA